MEEMTMIVFKAPVKLQKGLKALADKEERNLSAQIRLMLTKVLEAKGYLPNVKDNESVPVESTHVEKVG